ncbi:MAG: type I-C CRISPR-associated protein Cas8c/Csd1 [Bacteroidaceae bacterium]|nr:type I-C CRISPR-associated protein Cas8c/Csd1 [Bacteroidaceae bacterium]
MILKALYDYYHRCRKLYPNEMPALGFERITMDYVIKIKEDGSFVDVRPGFDCIAPRAVPNKTGKKAPANILWDSGKYMLNMTSKIEDEPGEHCNMIIGMLDELTAMFPDRTDFLALSKFYKRKEYKKLNDHELFRKLQKAKAITFMLDGKSHPVCQYSDELEEYIEGLAQKNPKGICLVTGEETNIFLTSGGVPLGIAKNGKLVSFRKGRGYDSHGKSQGENAPISVYAEYAYTAAIKRLTRLDMNTLKIPSKKHNPEKILVFWSSATDKEKSEELETKASLFVHLSQDNPDDVDSVKAFFSQVKKEGVTGTYGTETYYFLELVPTTKGRIAISFWNECSVKDFADIVLRHMDAMSIETNRKIKYDALSMVNSVSLCKIDNGSPTYDRLPNLIDSVFRSIFTGTPYPEVLFKTCLNRINAEQNRPSPKSKPAEYGRFENRDAERDAIIKAYLCFENRDAERAAIIKAYLCRNFNKHINSKMNTEINDRGYLCGRLFAVLERTQELANHETSNEWKSDLRSKYMNAAMSTPATVFPAILANSNYHLDKIPSIGWIEELKQEIIDKFGNTQCFPSILSMVEQGSFFIGYYQQRQAFFLKDNKKEFENK